MKISTKGRYGLRTLMDIAIHQNAGTVTLNEIAKRQQISAKYLWQIMSQLKNAGLVRGTRGPKGGYRLIRGPEEITLLDIVRILEGPVTLVECENECPFDGQCIAQRVWREISDTVGQALQGITLADIPQRHQSAFEASHYVI